MAQILGVNPVAGVATTFKVRFPTVKALPARALVQLFFPAEFVVETDVVSAKRNIECEFEVVSIEKHGSVGLQCLTLGFPTDQNEDAKSKPKPPEV